MVSDVEYIHDLLDNWSRTVALNDPWPHEISVGASLGFTTAEHEKEEIAKTGPPRAPYTLLMRHTEMENRSLKEIGQPQYHKISHEQLEKCSGTMLELFAWKSISLIHKGDIKDEIAYHHQATAKQKAFIRDNVVYVPQFLQNCKFVTEKPRGLSEQRQ
ncbi:uncharacterized protein EAE97_001429 [Botrytis byssoidea]|uniref:Uncharacterized protein n=1 Tax=Botrytis byssoidea TaxID=139641 RepID=A0A9P5IYI9_9HELO|nr:uncharacterized protein EAE97_001429 [Botrytis byssoidea]KAF7954031.1 hypothetical protein EAE97_001429 [Botrytis byssoidea]